MNNCRIGGVYRQRNGEVVTLVEYSGYDAVARCLSGGGLSGPRSLETGDDMNFDLVGLKCGDRSLIPGELHQVNGQWVPVEEERTELHKRELDAAVDFLVNLHKRPREVIDPNAAMLARDAAASKTTPRHLVKLILEDLATPVSKPSPQGLSFSPDLAGSTHQVNPAFGSASRLVHGS